MDAKTRRRIRDLPVREKLEFQTFPEPNTGCILWNGCVDKDGYGKIFVDKKHQRVHRVVYEMSFGKIPHGGLIQHSCDTPSCCNIRHLSLGTPLSNMQDKVRKGRLKNQNQNKTHCKHGHEFTPDNIYWGRSQAGNVSRGCRACAINHSRMAKFRNGSRADGVSGF